MELDLGRPIGISPQFSAHVVGDREVLLLSEQRSFRLSGRLYVAMLPYLDGRYTGREIMQAFAGRASEERLRTALGNMLDKSYACHLDADAPPGQQALWIELGLAPSEAERNLTRHSLAVVSVGSDAVSLEAARAMEQASRQAGIRIVARQDADLLVVSVDDYLRRDLEALNLDMRRAGRAWMPFKAGGSMPMLGPLFRPAAAPCWACLASRMAENRPGDSLLDGKIQAARPARAHNGATLALSANFAALELARALAHDKPSTLERHVVSLDLATRAYGEHLVRLDPSCPVCGELHDERRALERASEPLELKSRPVLPQVDGGWRSLTAEEVVGRLERYVSPITGVISGLENCSPDDGLPVFRARQTNPVHTSARQNRLVGRPGSAAGKGMSQIQAKASCLAEAMERYLCSYTGREARLRASWASLADTAPHPHGYLNYSDRQYDEREAWNKVQDGFNWVGERFDEKREIEWSPAWSLVSNQLRWLPARYCYFRYVDPTITNGESDNVFCAGDSNGCASGSTLEEAILQGFLELIERDACALWWYNRVRRPAFNLDSIDHPFIRRVRSHCSSLGRGLHVLDLTNDLNIPVAIALSYKHADGKSIMMGLGAHLDADVAISRALAEMNQMLSLEGMALLVDAEKKAQSKGDDIAMLNWLTNNSLETDPYCVADGTIESARYARPAIHDLKDAVLHCRHIVSDRGFDMIVLDHSRPEIDFAAARVVVPGLRHFWARFRAGRLYQAPVELGWLTRPLHESELNPIPFFM